MNAKEAKKLVKEIRANYFNPAKTSEDLDFLGETIYQIQTLGDAVKIAAKEQEVICYSTDNDADWEECVKLESLGDALDKMEVRITTRYDRLEENRINRTQRKREEKIAKGWIAA